MSDDLDPLEQELAGLKPRQPSPELQQRIGTEFEHSRRAVWVAALAAGIGTGAMILLFWFASRPSATTTRFIPPAPAPPAPVTSPEESQPTLQAYRRAFSRSPDDFEALLDKHAASYAESTTMTAYPRTESVSLGEY